VKSVSPAPAGNAVGRRGKASPSKVHPLRWSKGVLYVLEQRDLPHRSHFIPCRTHAQVAKTIVDMSVRGAPAIGCAAAFGLVLAAREKKPSSSAKLLSFLESAKKRLAKTRPTAVNLFWALERMASVWRKSPETPALPATLEREALNIFNEDEASCRRMGDAGAALLPSDAVVLTHCNTGALATAGHGTALGVIRSAWAGNKLKKVLVDETRPYLQGARLTAWELAQENIPYELITDNMAGHLMKTEKIAAVIVGADRIAANGDTANKIGTYSLAILAKYHNIPFYVVAPWSTVDLKTPSGARIPIEERSHDEVLTVKGVRLAPKGAKARHPAFDVTPAPLITAIITDRGIARAPYTSTLPSLSHL
jgi:methylthioribose-1-phosphate isomerase